MKPEDVDGAVDGQEDEEGPGKVDMGFPSDGPGVSFINILTSVINCLSCSVLTNKFCKETSQSSSAILT